MESLNVSQIVAFVVVWRFRYEGFPAESRVREDSTKPFLSNISFTDVLMTVEVRSERPFGIVGVHHGDVIEAEHAVEQLDRFGQSGRRGDVVARNKAMARINAEPDFEIGEIGGCRMTASSSNRPPRIWPDPAVFSISSLSHSC